MRAGETTNGCAGGGHRAGEGLPSIAAVMETTRVTTAVLLPGLDGTGDLFDVFVAHAPHDVECIAESFSGPIGVRLAARFPERVTRLVLCNSFVTPPRSRTIDAPHMILQTAPVAVWEAIHTAGRT